MSYSTMTAPDTLNVGAEDVLALARECMSAGSPNALVILVGRQPMICELTPAGKPLYRVPPAKEHRELLEAAGALAVSWLNLLPPETKRAVGEALDKRNCKLHLLAQPSVGVLRLLLSDDDKIVELAVRVIAQPASIN